MRRHANHRILATLMLLCAIGCGDRGDPDGTPDVILISIDTLRRDALGIYSGRRPSSTPNLDVLGADSVMFASAFAPIPFTLPSHMSMLTGVSPEVHGVNGHSTRLGAQIPTLAELLSAAGYRTHAVVSSNWLKDEFGFARGFRSHEIAASGFSTGESINDRGLGLLEELSLAEEPFFLFLHYFEPHSDLPWGGANVLPYYAPPPFGLDVPKEVAERC